MIPQLNAVEVLTLFVTKLEITREFYTEVFGSTLVYEDDVSAVMKLQNIRINLLKRTEAEVLVAPQRIADDFLQTTMLLTIRVDSVDDVCRELQEHGVSLLNGPVDRPWGRRTAAFSDPDGHVWEVAQEL